ncbi:MAG: hypothetical protein A2X25_14565 [Chloroflexi bacterium GWB2_49_20]|nr:MAG: hypothetical protein A2X25_14565 [Chloroflexi bacterium GWB2_49_20]OGN77264.1 MAG: hypothetical protein A2X26_08680 [Chloroflexi bacterium GWC2_49_37]OGN84739.1 MAG: hypothetical protein A2X27_15425 [Chloroflexi bacterium GWD2_49_16]HBG75098.1 hypothetical protein [Anaerolineae bacterium]HCC78449.1 hypothetical protein [Anaerolineae bacterium]
MENPIQIKDLSPVEPNVKQLLELLTGEKGSFDSDVLDINGFFERRSSGIGYSQFNELLLTLGYHRVSPEFFQFLIDGTCQVTISASLGKIGDLENGIKRFRRLALFAFGNMKFAFRRLSTEPVLLEEWLEGIAPIDPGEFKQRHEPIHPIKEISGEDTYYLGYLIQDNIKKALEKNPNDSQALAEDAKGESIIQIGIKNYQAYLASDHLDVYIATSMRERHEYYLANRWINSIFSHEKLTPLKLRWFDPTQAYCLNRIDKGLFEGLMLKRAKFTIYFSQEIDSLGKDSELASTLAQGKSVIAYVPTVDDEYTKELLERLIKLDTEKDIRQVILNQLRIFDPKAAWIDPEVQRWLSKPSSMNLDSAKAKLKSTMQDHYDKRAEVLSKTHPLGIQVNLRTGVANGVMVVRNINDCVELIYRIMTNAMEFSLEEQIDNNKKYVYLKENISGCIYRVVSGDPMLTNSFWGYYLNE